MLCLVARIDGVTFVWAPANRLPRGFVWSGGALDTSDEVPAWLLGAAETHTFVAHNATFDATACDLLLGLRPRWYDTLPCARAAGLPGKLDEIGEALLGAGKDEAGAKVMKMLTRAKHSRLSGEYEYPIGTAPAWEALLRYNVRDVDLLERVFEETRDYGEPDVLQADYAVNRRGVQVDISLADTLSAVWSHAQAEACEEIERLTQGVVRASQVRSVEVVKGWIESQGITLGSLDKNQVKRLIETPEEIAEDADSEALALVVEVLKLRQVATSAAAGKLATLRDSVDRDTGRMGDMLVIYGAQPGRWAGRGFQPQNLGRGHKGVDIERCLDALEELPDDGMGVPGYLAAEALRGIHPKIPLRDVLSTLTRPVFTTSAWNVLLIADYNAIEARGVAWVAGDDRLLSAFRDGRDPYCEMATSVFGRSITKDEKDEDARTVGKTIVLGCGYGMSGTKYGVYCRQNGIDLAALGTSAAECVKAYRERHKPIKRLWYALGDAVLECVGSGRRQQVGPVEMVMRGKNLHIILPSGRPIVYRCAAVEQQVPLYCKMLGLPEVPKPTVVYTHPRGYRKGVYGGLITENVVQGLCRDLLALALVRCEAEGLSPVMHVHDEIVCEQPREGHEERLRQMVEIMVEVPPWARGFPVGVEAFAGPRYAKSPFTGYTKTKGVSR